ncbi:MAG: GNAT family N-acetyltransferase [Pseudomonadota bacterium]
MGDPTIRRAQPFDAGAMAALLQAIIDKGGTTALRGPVMGADLRDWMAQTDTIWHVAELDGDILGFQWIGPNSALPPQACDIATFVDLDRHGLGIGTRLFDASRKAAKAAGFAWINATIRKENTGGLSYYQSRGFEPYGQDAEREHRRYLL